jgi:hypothetical protein
MWISKLIKSKTKTQLNRNLLILVLVLVAFNFTLLYILKANRKRVIIEQKTISEIEENFESLFFYYMELTAQYIDVNSALNNVIDQIISPTLIYVFSDEECSKCVFDDIFLLKEYLNEVKNNNNVFIFPVLDSTRLNNIRLSSELVGFNYLRIDKAQVILPQKNGVNVRFFAIVKPSGQIIFPFFPGINSSVETDKYLNYIFNKFYN